MAQTSEFSQFLTDDEKRFVNHLFTTSQNDDVFNSFSTEEKHYINELTRRMTNSSLHHQLNKGIFVNSSSSPQSTLNDVVFNMNSNPNANSERARNDLLHAAAGELDKAHRVNNDEAFYGFLPKKPSVFHSQNLQHSISQKQLQLQLQIAQFEMLKKQWLKNREELARGCGVFSQRSNYQNVPGRGTNSDTVFPGKVGLSPSAWPSVQKIGNINHKPVFPGNPSLKKERNGTGVFLPRVVDTESSRKKPVSRNVVVPERVVHALNRKVDEGVIRGYMQQKNRFENGDGRNGSDDGFFQQKRIVKAQQAEVNSEIQLPQEWTY